MVFHWRWSDNKSPKISRTLHNILPDLKNAVVWMVSSRPLISKASNPFINPLMTVPNSTNYYWYNCHVQVPQFLQFPDKGQGVYFPFYFLSVLLCGQPGQQCPQFCMFSFFVVDYYQVRSPGRDQVIRLYVKISLLLSSLYPLRVFRTTLNS